MSTPTDIIQLAFETLAVVQPGETISNTLRDNAFPQLNALLGQLSAEQASVFTQTFQLFNLLAGNPSYTLGVGGTMGTAKRAQRAISWSATYNNFRSSGPVLSWPDFQAQAQDALGMSSNIPRIVGADEAYPLINLRVFPTPSSTPGQIELAYWTPITQFATVSDVIALPDGWFQMLYTNLAVLLYPKYARVGGLPPEIAALAQSSKASLVQQNSPAQVAAQ